MCLAAVCLRRERFVWRFIAGNLWKCCRSLLGSPLYHENKYLSSIKHSLKVVQSSKTCPIRVDYLPLLIMRTANKLTVKNRRLGIREIVEDLSISCGSTQLILVNVSWMKRVNAWKNLKQLRNFLRVNFVSFLYGIIWFILKEKI